MRDRELSDYHLHGYEEFYSKALPHIREVLDVKLGDKEGYFGQAVVEAVENAAAYAKAGPEKAEIDIRLCTTAQDISVTVTSDTERFNVSEFRERLRRLAASPSGELEWGEMVGDSERSRGLWQILTGVDLMYAETDGHSITLAAVRPEDGIYKPPDSKKIKDIVPKLMLMRHYMIF